MMDCGNCGHWKFSRLSNADGIRLAHGVCGNTKSECYQQETPARFSGKCWGPEGGKGPRAEIEPKQIA